MKPFLSILSLATVASLVAFLPARAPVDVVRTEAGQVSGTLNAAGDVRIYRGIPFAAPPVGELRWKAPQPAQAWTGVRKCDAFGPSPMQGSPASFGPWTEEYLIPKEPISEDCLNLNVWTGARKAGEKRPVLVWIYGGGFNSGGNACAIYDGEAFAQKGVVFVSPNYRVGIFGFLAHPELSSESGRNASGNYGLMDQIAALQWVKKNIAAFGGDPNNVTIAGQSAGSMAVNCLVASPLAKGLFNKAIAQSGANMTGTRNVSLSQGEQDGVRIMKNLGAGSLADLRKIPAEELQKKGQGTRGPVVDGYVLPESVAQIVKAGKQNPITLLTGWNQDEGMSMGPPQKADAFRQRIEQQYGPGILQHYPAGTDAEAAQSQVYLSRDMIFGAQNYAWANTESDQGHKVYVYRFTRKVPALGEYARYGAFHTGEVPYAYDNLKFVNPKYRPMEAADQELAKIMASFWVNFIRSGDPNGKGLPTWPAYSTKDKRVMMLDVKPEAKPLPDGAALEYLLGKLSGV